MAGLINYTTSIMQSLKTEILKMKKTTQKERVLDYMKRFDGITVREAFNDLGVTQLAARICEIEADGHEVTKSYESTKNRFNESVSFVRYRLKEVS